MEYADSQVKALTHIEHRRILIELKNEQERALVMLGVDLPFAADVVEAPSAEQLPDWPDVPLVLTMALAAGLSVGVMTAVFRVSGRPRTRTA